MRKTGVTGTGGEPDAIELELDDVDSDGVTVDCDDDGVGTLGGCKAVFNINLRPLLQNIPVLVVAVWEHQLRPPLLSDQNMLRGLLAVPRDGQATWLAVRRGGERSSGVGLDGKLVKLFVPIMDQYLGKQDRIWQRFLIT